MTQFNAASPEMLSSNTDFEGIREVNDFDVLARAIGQSLLAKFDRDYPGYPSFPVADTMYGTALRPGPDQGTITIARRLMAFKPENPADYFAHMLKPTLPTNDIFFLRNYHVNLLTGVRDNGVRNLLETQIYLDSPSRHNQTVAVRKQLPSRVTAIPEEDFPAFMERRRRPRILTSRPVCGQVISQESAKQHADRARSLTAEEINEQLGMDI